MDRSKIKSEKAGGGYSWEFGSQNFASHFVFKYNIFLKTIQWLFGVQPYNNRFTQQREVYVVFVVYL